MSTHAEDLKPLDTSSDPDQPTPDEAQRPRDPLRTILEILILPLARGMALLMAVLTGVVMLKCRVRRRLRVDGSDCSG